MKKIMKIKFIFAWYDFWVGWYWDSAKRYLYILPIPCFGIRLDFGSVGGYVRALGVVPVVVSDPLVSDCCHARATLRRGVLAMDSYVCDKCSKHCILSDFPSEN